MREIPVHQRLADINMLDSAIAALEAEAVKLVGYSSDPDVAAEQFEQFHKRIAKSRSAAQEMMDLMLNQLSVIVGGDRFVEELTGYRRIEGSQSWWRERGISGPEPS